MFDPYYKWLGIIPKDQPPHHYRLLGVEVFEGDLDVIEGAADRQMGFVRQYQSGENATHAAKILNELAIARLCLLKPATKKAYDAKLRQALAPPEPEFPDLPLSTGEAVNERAPKKGKKKSAKSKASGVPQPLMIGGGIAVVAVAILAVFLSSGRPQPRVEAPNKSDSVAATNPAKPSIEAAKSAAAVTDDRSLSNSLQWSDSKLMTEPAGDPVDLLKLLDPKRDFVSGAWQQTATALIGPAQSSLYLPVKLPEDYQLKFAIRRLEGADTLMIGFMMASRQGMLAIDGWDATCTGLYVDGREGRDNCTTRQGSLFKGQSAGKIVLTVHPGHLHVTFDGQTIVDWHGNPERLFLHSAHAMASRESPFLLTSKAKYVFESASLIPIKPQPVLSRPARLDRDVDVVPLVDLDRDVQRGIWSVSKGGLYSPEGWGKIYLPTVVPEEYTLSGTVELPVDNRGNPSLAIGLPSGGFLCQITLKNDDCLGIDMVDGIRWNLNESRFSGPCLIPGVPAKFACTVTKSGIRMEIDNRTLIDWRGEPWHLSVPGDWVPADDRRLYFGALTHFKLRDIKLTAPVLPPKSPPHATITTAKPVDLLSLIDPARDARVGTWTKEGNVLRTMADFDLTKLIVPVDVPDEYRLTMRLAREPGGTAGNDAINLLLPVGSAKADIVIDGTRSQFTGIRVGSKDWNENATLYKGAVIPQGPPVELVVDVKATGIKLTCQGKQIIEWTGNPENFSCQYDRRMPGPRIGLAAWQSRFRIEKLEIQALPPSSFPVVKPQGSDGKLLPIVDVQRDSRGGDWKLEGDRLTCPMLSGCRLRIPVAVPPRYVFSAMVERIQGGGHIYFGLPVSGQSTSITIDGEYKAQAGIDLLDGHRYTNPVNLVNRRYKEPMLPQNRSVAVRCFILPDTIVVTCGDKELIRWHGDPRRLSVVSEFIPPNYSTADRTRLWLGAWDSQFVFRDLELRPLTDAESETLLKSFSGVFPTTSQSDVPLATVRAN